MLAIFYEISSVFLSFAVGRRVQCQLFYFASSCQVCRRWPLRSRILIRNFHHVGHALLSPRLSCMVMSSSPGGGRRLLPFSKMADVVALTACPNVIANWWKELHLPASSLHPNIGHAERSSDRVETVLVCSSNLPGSIETTTPGI